MTLGDIATKARALVNADTVSYPDANLLIDINIWYQKVISMILESMDEQDFDDMRKTDYPIKTTSMVAGQRDYSIPVSEKVLKIKRVDLSYDGTHYYKANPLDDGEVNYGWGNDTDIDVNFSQYQPRYDVKYNSIFIYPLGVSGGIVRVEWERNVTPFTSADYTTVLTDSTVVPGFDDPFHPMLAAGPAWEFAVQRQLPQLGQLTTGLQDWELRLRTAYGKKNLDRVLALSAYQDDSYYR